MGIYRRKNEQYEAFIQVNYVKHRKSFDTRKEAEDWIKKTEIENRLQNTSRDYTVVKRMNVENLGDLFVKEYLRRKGNRANDERILKAFLRKFRYSKSKLADLDTIHFTQYRDMRLETVKPSTFKREMDVVSCMFNVAIKDWGYRMDNPLAKLRRPTFNNARDRVLTREEVITITTQDYPIRDFVIVLMETGVRRGECLQIKKEHIDFENRLLTLPKENTKNGYQRIIPLTNIARDILFKSLEWGFTARYVRREWEKFVKKWGIKNLRMHDLRHYALTQFGEMGLSPMQLQIISGHRDLRLLLRYCHMKPQNVLKDQKFQSTTLLGSR